MSKIFELLQKRYPPAECVIMQEVSDTTGHSRSRSADFIIVNLWPSRGNSVIGMEQKISRSDWLREIKDPKKQEAHFKFCDYFYLITEGEKIAKLEEIPASWGWIDVRGSSLKTMKEAPRLTPVPLEKGFICSMLRRAAAKDSYVHRDTLEGFIEEKAAVNTKNMEYKMSSLQGELESLQTRVKEFVTASGLQIDGPYNYQLRDWKKVGEAVKFVIDGGIDKYPKRLEELKNTVAKIHSDILLSIEKLPVDGK